MYSYCVIEPLAIEGASLKNAVIIGLFKRQLPSFRIRVVEISTFILTINAKGRASPLSQDSRGSRRETLQTIVRDYTLLISRPKISLRTF